jgi:MFS family permease
MMIHSPKHVRILHLFSSPTPGPTMIGLIVSILEIGAFLGSLFTAAVSEDLGQKKSITIGVVVMILGAILQATTFHGAHLIVARVVAGVVLGVAN